MIYTQKTFTGGEISPALHKRNDLDKYASGLKKLKNGFVRQEGCISNRPGTYYIGAVKDSSKKTRLIPFSFNTEQTYIIEAGNQYFRFIKDGGYIVYPDDYSDVDKRGQIVEISTSYTTAELPYLKYAQNADVLTICHPNHAPMELARNSHYDWTLSAITFDPKISAPENVTAVWTGSNLNPRTYEYLVTAVNADGEESKRSSTVSVTGRYEANWATGEYTTVSWNAVTGAEAYNVYRNVNGVFAYIGTSESTSFVDNKIEPDVSACAPVEKHPFDNSNYPSVINYFQQRKIYANTKNNPQTIYASQTGLSNNFYVSKPLVATDAVTITLSEREVNEIRHIVAMNDLVILTSSAEWKLNGSDGAFEASPPPVAKPQSYHGSSHVMPVVSGNMILFVQAGGSILRDLGYTYVSDSYDGDELTIFAQHIFEGKQIIDMAFAKEPYKLVYCVLSDGTLAVLTYNPKQQIAGWSRYETDGEFESVAVIREGFEDVAYFIVKRTINNTTKRYLERCASRIVNTVTESSFSDCSLKQEFLSAITTVSGLSHLEGKTVSVNADGGVETHTVTSGQITLNNPAKKIIVGLPYDFELETLGIDGENTQPKKKIINRVYVEIDRSREDFDIIGDDGTVTTLPRSLDSINNSDLLISGETEITPYAYAQNEATVKIKQSKPLPLTILSISSEIDVER